MGPMTFPRDPVDELASIPASQVKRRGWRGVMRTLGTEGVVLVTNHGEPEAVILPPDAYASLLERIEQAEPRIEDDLEALRRRFDERLAALLEAGSGARLRAVMGEGARLGGKVKAGSGP